jgi:hypothetical protein
VRCAWNANATGEDRIVGADDVWADVLASDQVAAATKDHYSVARCEGMYDGTVCRLGVDVAGSWTLVSTGILDYGAEVAPDVLAELASFVETNASEHPSPVPSVRTADWWPRPDCEALGAAIGLDEFFSNAAAGYWEGGPGAFERVLSDAGLQVECPWVSEYVKEGDTWGSLTVIVAPGSGWMWSEMRQIEQDGTAEGPRVVSEDIDIAGAVAARQLTYGEGQEAILATDGTNIVRIMSTAGGPVIAERVLASLAQGR